MNKLEQLRTMTTIVVDSGDIEAIKEHKPTDATTNPSLILQAANLPQYAHLIEDAVKYAETKGESKLLAKLFVNFGCEILKIIPGRVSTEVDARYSFDIESSIEMAKSIIALYEESGFPRERVLIKLAATWEGVQAAHALEKEGIHCNMTLIFSLAQAVASAQVGATLISPFVGRILDWYKKTENVSMYPPPSDPGVKSVSEIYSYLKKFTYKTQVMGASFRNKEEVLELAGCDLLTISPTLLTEIEKETGNLERKLHPEKAHSFEMKKLAVDEKTFRWMLNENPMATDKLAEGIRKFTLDIFKLEKQMKKIQELNLALKN